jgi:hypothetical protein
MARVIAPAGVLAACCAIFLAFGARGFDVSDDAFYILSTVDAAHYRKVLTEFGPFWNPVLWASGGNLYAFRLAGALLLLGCAALFAFSVCRGMFSKPEDRALQACAAAAIITSAFWHYGAWLPTPNYNLLNLCGVLLFLSGVLMATAPNGSGNGAGRGEGPVWQAGLAGLGLCLTLVAKPTTTVAGGLLGLLWIMVWPPRRYLLAILVAAATAIGLYGGIIFLFDGNISDFLARKAFALNAMAVLDRGNSISGLKHTLFGPLLERGVPKVIAVGSLSIALLSLMLVWWRLALSGRAVLAGALAVLSALLVGILRARDGMWPMPSTAFHAWHFAILLAMAAIVALSLRLLEVGAGRRRLLAGAAILAFTPLAYAIGTNSTIALQVSGAAIFWCAAAILLIGATPKEARQRLLPAAAFLMASLTLGMMLGVVAAPHRGTPSLLQQSFPLPLRDGMTVGVDFQSYTHFTAFREAARRQGFAPGTAVIDTTGEGPGMVLALGGRAPGIPWLHRGGNDMMAFSRLMLRQIPAHELGDVWLITSADSQQAMEAELLRSLGVDFPGRFQPVVSARSPQNGLTHILWKPRLP